MTIAKKSRRAAKPHTSTPLLTKETFPDFVIEIVKDGKVINTFTVPGSRVGICNAYNANWARAGEYARPQRKAVRA